MKGFSSLRLATFIVGASMRQNGGHSSMIDQADHLLSKEGEEIHRQRVTQFTHHSSAAWIFPPLYFRRFSLVILWGNIKDSSIIGLCRWEKRRISFFLFVKVKFLVALSHFWIQKCENNLLGFDWISTVLISHHLFIILSSTSQPESKRTARIRVKRMKMKNIKINCSA